MRGPTSGYWNWVGVLGVIAGLTAYIMAGRSPWADRRGPQNRRLAFVLALEASTGFFADGFVFFVAWHDPAYVVQTPGWLAFGAMNLAYPLFLSTFPVNPRIFPVQGVAIRLIDRGPPQVRDFLDCLRRRKADVYHATFEELNRGGLGQEEGRALANLGTRLGVPDTEADPATTEPRPPATEWA